MSLATNEQGTVSECLSCVVKMDWKTAFGVLGLAGWCAFCSPVEAGQLYKWTDAQGNLHITDVPPLNSGNGPVSVVEPTPPATNPVPPGKKTAVTSQTPPGGKRVEVERVPRSMVSPQSVKTSRGQGAQVPAAGLKPGQATVASPWEVVDGKQGAAKARVQRWKDERGIEHFVDVLPSGNGSG